MNPTDKKCRNCFFGYPLDGGEKFKCHVNRPTLTNGHFPIVKGCEWCSLWTDEKTLERPFIIPVNGLTYLNAPTQERKAERGE